MSDIENSNDESQLLDIQKSNDDHKDNIAENIDIISVNDNKDNDFIDIIDNQLQNIENCTEIDLKNEIN